METRNVKITLDTAKKWYKSNNEALKKVALQAFTEKELDGLAFKNIKTLKDACKILNLSYERLMSAMQSIENYSRASACLVYIQIIRKALNIGYTMELTNGDIYYPWVPFKVATSNYKPQNSEKIGEIMYKGVTYSIFGGRAVIGSGGGLGNLPYDEGLGNRDTNLGLLGCATQEIACHFSKYFGVLITKALYGDLPNIQIYSV